VKPLLILTLLLAGCVTPAAERHMDTQILFCVLICFKVDSAVDVKKDGTPEDAAPVNGPVQPWATRPKAPAPPPGAAH
jgi:hypothetical protein